MECIDKIVDFEYYCPLCKHEKDPENKDPCHDCLNNPTNTYSYKPVNFEEKPKKEKKK